jgi:hypothetical protein
MFCGYLPNPNLTLDNVNAVEGKLAVTLEPDIGFKISISDWYSKFKLV